MGDKTPLRGSCGLVRQAEISHHAGVPARRGRSPRNAVQAIRRTGALGSLSKRQGAPRRDAPSEEAWGRQPAARGARAGAGGAGEKIRPAGVCARSRGRCCGLPVNAHARRGSGTSPALTHCEQARRRRLQDRRKREREHDAGTFASSGGARSHPGGRGFFLKNSSHA